MYIRLLKNYLKYILQHVTQSTKEQIQFFGVYLNT